MTETGRPKIFGEAKGQMGSQNSLPPSAVVEIKFSPWQVFAALVVSAVFTGGGLFLLISLTVQSSAQKCGLYFSTFFFGVCLIRSARWLLNLSHPVITIAPEGILDTRLTAEFIPWDEVIGLQRSSYGGNRFMILILKPEFTKRLKLTMFARWTRIPNSLLGIKGLAIGVTGLKTGYRTLLETTLTYARAYGSHIR